MMERVADAVVLGVILAGGRSSRMGGGDKCLRRLGDRTLLDHVVERLQPQVAKLLLNANGEPQRFAKSGLVVVPDALDEAVGPLGGILSCMEWGSRNAPHCCWIATVPSDTPFLPRHLVARLLDAAPSRRGIVCACSLGRRHPVIGLWPVALAGSLREAVVDEGLRAVGAFVGRHLVAEVDFAAEGGVDPFFNINRPDDLAMAEAMLRQG